MNFLKGIYDLKGGKYAYIFYGEGENSYGIVSDTPHMRFESWDGFGNHDEDEDLNIMAFKRTEENYSRAANSSSPEAQDRDSFSSRMQLKSDKGKEV